MKRVLYLAVAALLLGMGIVGLSREERGLAELRPPLLPASGAVQASEGLRADREGNGIAARGSAPRTSVCTRSGIP